MPRAPRAIQRYPLRTIARQDRPALRSADQELAQPLASLPPPLLSSGIVQFQHTLGNRRLARMLQAPTDQILRDSTPNPAADSVPMPAWKVQAALNWYRSQPQRYTPAIIMQIQTAMKTTPTGVMSEQDVQAVARFQLENFLKVDGMAGPRTLPAVFKGGLADDKATKKFAADAREITDAWDTLGSVDARKDAFDKKINEHLAAIGVPTCKVILGDTGIAEALFTWSTWTITLKQAALEGKDPDIEHRKDITGSVYHEARHAEQNFRIAQMLRGRGKTEAQIAKETEILGTVISAASSKPLAPGTMEALIAEGWYESLFGTQKAHRLQVHAQLKKADDAKQQAKADFTASPTPANKQRLDAAVKRRNYWFVQYHNLPEENDAQRVEDEVKATYEEAEPVPEPTPGAKE